ncbi:MAG: hypothetical protein KDA61_21875, partial [Planctomycetales bacterium]|nr:hypothetical protein [Planctomycetales bacterium]
VPLYGAGDDAAAAVMGSLLALEGIDAEVLEDSRYLEQLEELADDRKSVVVAVSLATPHLRRVRARCGQIRRAAPNAPLVVTVASADRSNAAEFQSAVGAAAVTSSIADGVATVRRLVMGSIDLRLDDAEPVPTGLGVCEDRIIA